MKRPGIWNQGRTEARAGRIATDRNALPVIRLSRAAHPKVLMRLDAPFTDRLYRLVTFLDAANPNPFGGSHDCA